MQEVDLCINGIWLLDVNLGLSTDRKRIKVYQKCGGREQVITIITINRYCFKFIESGSEENKSYEIRNRDIEEE